MRRLSFILEPTNLEITNLRTKIENFHQRIKYCLEVLPANFLDDEMIRNFWNESYVKLYGILQSLNSPEMIQDSEYRVDIFFKLHDCFILMDRKAFMLEKPRQCRS